ncbi:adenine phosphoribosyltransferase [Rhodococcus sp. NPDC057529]|uniref:adenine phosphoribosyltransferase n=2 Tax=unclassified Rhodococcus (in: high G+C Gram-positive bacteria) TaxID=192944 RepID=UPI003670556C
MTDHSAARDAVTRLTRWADDFPQPGVRFADLTPVFSDADGFRVVVDALAACAPAAEVIAAVDARGFLLGGGVARELGSGVVAVRKSGKLPPPVLSQAYTLEYGTATLEIPAGSIGLDGRSVLVVDDVLATGGTLDATARLVESAGARVIGIAVVLEIAALGGRERLGKYPLTSLVTV